ncbi:hypothetical protein Dimus_008240, partial [Dionaea muscipula]
MISAFSSFVCSDASTVMLSQLIVSSAMAHVQHEAEIGGSSYPMHSRVRPPRELDPPSCSGWQCELCASPCSVAGFNMELGHARPTPMLDLL